MHEALLSQIPNFIQKDLGATGVYVSIKDHPKLVYDPANDDLYAHKDINQPKVLQYIGACDDHAFIMDQAIGSEDFIYELL